ncbi:MAG: hypothetical protein ACRDQA_09795 [Nocardioidaceae bacterium]
MQDSDDRSLVERIYRSADPDGSLLPSWVIARNAVTAAVLVAVALQIVVWAAICLGTGHLASAWWLWTLAGGTLLIALVWLLGSTLPTSPTSDQTRSGERSAQPWRFSWGWLYRLLVVLFIVSSAAQFIVWLVQGLAGQFDAPWWTWSVLPFAVIVAATWVLAHDEKKRWDREASQG